MLSKPEMIDSSEKAKRNENFDSTDVNLSA